MLSQLYKCLDETEIAACGVTSSNNLEDETLLNSSEYCPKDFPKEQKDETNPTKKTSSVQVVDLEWGSWVNSTSAAVRDYLGHQLFEEVGGPVYEPFL